MTLEIRLQSGLRLWIHDTGDIQRMDIPHTPSGEWKMRGLRHVRRAQAITLSQLRRAYGPSDVWPAPIPDLLFKNGKGQWLLADVDHGANRVMSDRVISIRKVAAVGSTAEVDV